MRCPVSFFPRPILSHNMHCIRFVCGSLPPGVCYVQFNHSGSFGQGGERCRMRFGRCCCLPFVIPWANRWRWMLLVASCAISGPIKRGVQQGCADGLPANVCGMSMAGMCNWCWMLARPPQPVFHMPTSRPGMHVQQGDGWAAGGMDHAAGGRAALSYLPTSCYGRGGG
jgi:hypothetical protein